jgi:autotransporter passenger strand-loop-strand repeat protein/autotransporter-associated beta strand protein
MMTLVSKGQTLTTSAGQVVSGLTVSSGGVVLGAGVLEGASTDAGVVSGLSLGAGSAGDLASLAVLSGGLAQGVTVKAGVSAGSVVGGLKVSAAGVTSFSMISSGGAETVSSGGHSQFATVSGGGIEIDLAGGVVAGATVNSGGLLSGPGIVSGYTLVLGSAAGITYAGSSGYGASPTLEIAGSARSVTVSSGTIQIDRGGLAVADHVLSGAVEHDELGGRVSGSVISSGGLEIFSGFGEILGVGEATSVTVNKGAIVELVSAFISSGAALPAAGLVTSATTYNGVTVSSGGEWTYLLPEIFSGRTLTAQSADAVNGALVFGGGAMVVSSGAEVDGTLLSSGATLYLSSGATEGNGLYVSAGGVVSGPGAIIGTGVAEVAGTISGVAVGVVSNSVGIPVQGHLEIQSGGKAIGVTVVPIISCYIQIDGGATASGDVISNNTSEFVKSGGVVFGTKIYSGGNEYVSAGAVASGATVFTGGTQNVLSGGVASSPLISSGALAVATSGGKVIGAAVTGTGATLGVTAGGDALLTTVGAGGALVLLASGLASGVQVSSGGSLVVSSGALALAVAESAGGVIIDNGTITISGSGATALSGTLTGSGGLTVAGSGTVVLGGTASAYKGAFTLSGGTLEDAAAAGLGGAPVVFAVVSAILKIDQVATPAAGKTFANVLSNFARAGDAIDLAGLAYVSGATVSASGGTLALSEGGKTYDFSLVSSVASAYAVAKDAGSGTIITVKTASLLAQAAAGFGASAGSVPEAVHSIAEGEARPLILAAASGWGRAAQA